MRVYKIIILYFLSIALLYSRENDIEIIEQDMDKDNKEEMQQNGLFLHGGLEIFNKTAFSTKQIVPNNSYGYALGQLNLGYQYNEFQFMIGIVAAGLTYDSTNGLGYKYVGAYPGYLNNVEPTAENTHNAFIHNAFVWYKTDSLNIKAGRFQQENDEWFDSYAEGVNAIYQFDNNFHIKFFGSSTVALVGNGWLADFSTAYSHYGILNAEVGYQDDFLNANAYIYYGAKEYFAPGFNVKATFKYQKDISFTGKASLLFPIYSSSIVNFNDYFFSGFRDTIGFTSSILVRGDVDIYDTYKLALAIYKNIGNANARMGMFGNPIGIDIWDNSVYGIGVSLNAAVAPDAFSVLAFTEARYKDLANFVKDLSIGINGRYTTAPSATEYSLKFIIDWQVIDSVNIGLIANYYTHIMINEGWNKSNITIQGPKSLDRSYLMSSINYSF